LREQIERVELHFVVVLLRAQIVKVGDAIETEDASLVVQHELCAAAPARRVDDPGLIAWSSRGRCG